jgi:hypothetical protein
VVQKLEIRACDLAGPPLVNDFIDKRDRGLGEDTNGGCDDLKPLFAKLIDREQRLVLPGDQHIAEAAFHERNRRPRAAVSSIGTFL